MELDLIGRTMICGLNTHYDLYRPGRCHSAFVASRDDNCSSWWFNVGLYTSLEQVIEQISANIVEASKVFKSHNEKLPERVLVYVDGVAVSKLELVLCNELELIRATIREGVGRLKLSVIFINRTIGLNSNLRLGRNRLRSFCLIDDCTSKKYDTSAEFKIVHDENEFSIEMHELLAQQLSETRVDRMGRATVPAPCQMAQELVELCHKLHNKPKA